MQEFARIRSVALLTVGVKCFLVIPVEHVRRSVGLRVMGRAQQLALGYLFKDLFPCMDVPLKFVSTQAEGLGPIGVMEVQCRQAPFVPTHFARST